MSGGELSCIREASSLPQRQSSCFRAFTRYHRKMDKALSLLPREVPAAPERPIDVDPSRAIVAKRSTYAHRHHIKPHWHGRAQFVFAVEGTMTVRTPRRQWIVPPSRALWVPARTVHEIQMYGVVEMRSLYVDEAAAGGMPGSCVVLTVTPLLRELVVRAVAVPGLYDEDGDEGLLMRLLMAEIRRLSACALALPLPESADLTRLCERILGDLSSRRPCGVDAEDMQVSTRTLYRRFLKETGI